MWTLGTNFESNGKAKDHDTLSHPSTMYTMYHGGQGCDRNRQDGERENIGLSFANVETYHGPASFGTERIRSHWSGAGTGSGVSISDSLGLQKFHQTAGAQVSKFAVHHTMSRTIGANANDASTRSSTVCVCCQLFRFAL